MSQVYGAIAGLLWGALAAFANMLINRAALKKNSSGAMLAANIFRLLVDLIALGTVFLLRGRLPFGFEAAVIGTAASLSVLGIVFSYLIIRPRK